MAECIEREAVINRIKKYASEVYGIDLDDAEQFSGDSLSENYCEGLYEATELIAEIPAADVAPVVHARWLDAPWLYYGAKQYVCSRCRDDEYWRKRELHFKEPYCPNCGAKMGGGDGNG